MSGDASHDANMVATGETPPPVAPAGADAPIDHDLPPAATATTAGGAGAAAAAAPPPLAAYANRYTYERIPRLAVVDQILSRLGTSAAPASTQETATRAPAEGGTGVIEAHAGVSGLGAYSAAPRSGDVTRTWSQVDVGNFLAAGLTCMAADPTLLRPSDALPRTLDATHPELGLRGLTAAQCQAAWDRSIEDPYPGMEMFVWSYHKLVAVRLRNVPTATPEAIAAAEAAAEAAFLPGGARDVPVSLLRLHDRVMTAIIDGIEAEEQAVAEQQAPSVAAAPAAGQAAQ